ncbi:MAG TPA: FliM/FliN family flagellar motor C-terminal domain-containing protein, partial [Novosphingobium sp.]|nr:FliM/FliN family flagellar motor C-terminal domain-containing protein [Novosphingobium sp.]
LVGLSASQVVALGHDILEGRAELAHSRDREILSAVGRAAVADLGDLLSAAARQGDNGFERWSEAPPGARRYRLTCAGRKWSVEISLGGGVCVRLRQSRTGFRRPPALTALRTALSVERITLGCHLGTASISAGELHGLAAGDLIVLDRQVADALPLTLQGELAPRGQGTISKDEEDLVLRITQTPQVFAGDP